MAGSQELFAAARRAIPHGVDSPVRYYDPYPFFAARADGATLWDADGRALTDLCCGYGALLLGHRRREIISAVSRQLKKGTLYCVPTGQETELAGMIRGLYPSMRRVRLVNTGAEATMTAIRLARGHTGRKKIVMFGGCYHGAHDSVLVRAGGGRAGVPASAGAPGGVHRHTLVARYNDFGDIEDVIRGDGDIAGVIIEPVMANAGLVPPARGFLRYVRRLTHDAGIPLIFDEVVTGFRVSAGGAQAHYKIKPDITTLAKALGGGFAIAAVGGRRDIMEELAPGGRVYQASTYAGNPVAVSAAIASIRTINRTGEKMYPKLERGCARLAAAVGDAASDLGIEHAINRLSSMMQIFFAPGPVTGHAGAAAADPEMFKRLFDGLLDNGVFVPPSQSETVFISDAHTGADLDRAAEAYAAALRGAAR